MDEVVVALEGGVAPMNCFVDDTRLHACCARTRRTRGTAAPPSCCGLRVQGGVMERLAADHARRARRVQRSGARRGRPPSRR